MPYMGCATFAHRRSFALLALLPSFPAVAAPVDPVVGSPVSKKENPMSLTGTVKFFNPDKGFGFISPDAGGTDAFVHISAVERAGFPTLKENQRVSYELENDKRGRTSAVNLGMVE
jgi:CspA family cold shock protein